MSCSVEKYIPDGEFFLNDIHVTCDDAEIMKSYQLGSYVTQNTNTKWFGARVPLKIYCLSGTNINKRSTRLLRKIGEAPVLYDSTKAEKTAADIKHVLANSGYMKASVEQMKDTANKRMSLTYHVTPGERYMTRNVSREVADPQLRKFIFGEDTTKSLLKQGAPFDINKLNEERNRITNTLRSSGYYKFTKSDISFSADTANNSLDVDVTLRIKLHQENGRTEATLHKPYTIGDVVFMTDLTGTEETTDLDTIHYKNAQFVHQGRMHFRKNLLLSNSYIRSGDLYNDSHLKQTYTNYTRLPAISMSNIHLTEREGTDTLDCNILVHHNKPYTLGFDVEATNSAGDLGAATSLSLQNNNLFRGSETFMIKLRGAYEAITGLDGYEGSNYTELGGEMRLQFPAFLLPCVKRDWVARHGASSEISVQYNLQNRPEFNRRVLSAAWRYKWNSKNRHVQNKFDLLEVSYVYMPWISKTFKEQYLDSLGKTNAILKYNYENLLITKLGYTYSYNSLGASEQTYGKNAYTLRFNIETSGNVLNSISKMTDAKKNEEGQYKFCGIAFAQYVRGDFDVSKSIRIDHNNSLALHGALGIAYPYGNSNQLPFEKRYFAGGANSVRGWSVRSLGPGSYNGKDKGINFLNQSGDIKLDMSLEFRAKLFWKFSGAAFVDAGNIWTIRKYEDQPGGEFRLDKFMEQIAVSYGIGLRMDANFFIVRFDGGMKAIDPAFSNRKHYPILRHSFKRDFAFHFAVGLPF